MAEQEIGVLTDYFTAAMRHANYQPDGDDPVRLYATIPGIDGLWARGQTREITATDLRSALEWFVLTAIFDHHALPAFDGVSLEITEENLAGETVVYPVAL